MKKILIFLMILSMVCLAVSCGGSAKNSESTAKTTVSAPNTTAPEGTSSSDIGSTTAPVTGADNTPDTTDAPNTTKVPDTTKAPVTTRDPDEGWEGFRPIL